MSSITNIESTDLITDSRADLNNNFSALNTDKIETSVIDTDPTLAADSDAKLPSQKAVKAYVDAGGNVNATETTKGISQIATDAQIVADTDIGSTGASLFVIPSKLNTQIDAKIAAGGASYASGVTTHDISSVLSTTIAHGLGATPTFVNVIGTFVDAGTDSRAEGTIVGATQYAIYSAVDNAFNTNTGAAFRLHESTTRYNTGTLTVDATNITIAWSKTGTPTGTANLLWVAQK